MNITIWEQEFFYTRKDVIIIGGGLAGLWCACELLTKHRSLKLLILDRGELMPEGASTRNAGFACFGSATELLRDAKQMGEEKMLQVTDMRYRGIRKIRDLFGDHIIDYDPCGGYECLHNNGDSLEELFQNIHLLNDSLSAITGIPDTYTIASEKLAALGLQGFEALIENKQEGGLHSGKLVLTLQEKVTSLGGQIRQGIQVRSCTDDGDEVIVYTKELTFFASHVINCTNASISDGITPARGQILVTQPITNLKLRGTFHFDEGYYYFRNIGNRVLLGGARNKAFDEENTNDFNTTYTIQNELERFLATHILPNQTYKIDYRWSGIMGFTADKQPLIKKLSPRMTAVCICNGMGVALSPIAAEQIEL